MVKRLLSALEYPSPELVKLNDEKALRGIIAWTELNKISRCNSDLRRCLQDVESSKWEVSFDTYKKLLQCPQLDNLLEYVQWILGYAIQLETHRKRDVYIKHAVNNLKISSAPNVIVDNPLDNFDFSSQEFANGINALAKILNIIPHPNHLITLEAITKVVTSRLSPEALRDPSQVVIKGTPFPIQDSDLGFDLKDPVLNRAAKFLRLLYIQDLRKLQTSANELIVSIQNITANPKTDTKLGKVGR